MISYKSKKVCVIGLGYIGLPTAALLANEGYNVVGVDINKKNVSIINAGKVHLVEPELDSFVKSAVMLGKLTAYTEMQRADIYIICVPTPLNKDETVPSPNMQFIDQAVESLKCFLKPNDLLILESTSPIGTTLKIKLNLLEANIDLTKIHIAYCPERVLPGKIIKELIANDRIVGGLNQKSSKIVADFYRSFVKGTVYETDSKTAEMSKLAENSFRDLNIAFANELSIICDVEDINIWNLIKLTNRHPRVNILDPGVGVGGHCIAIDPWFMINKHMNRANLIRTGRNVNDQKIEWVINKIKENASKINHFKNTKLKIACLGIAFKPNVNDLRESPALLITETLMTLDFEIIVVEPNLKSHPKFPLSYINEALNQADLICVFVKHKEFLKPKVVKILKNSLTLDFCGVLNQ